MCLTDTCCICNSTNLRVLNSFLTLSDDLDLSMTFKSNMAYILMRLNLCVKCIVCVICHKDTCNTCYPTNLRVLNSFLTFSNDLDLSMTFKSSMACILMRLNLCVKCTVCVIRYIDTSNTCYSTNLRMLISILTFSIELDLSMTFRSNITCILMRPNLCVKCMHSMCYMPYRYL